VVRAPPGMTESPAVLRVGMEIRTHIRAKRADVRNKGGGVAAREISFTLRRLGYIGQRLSTPNMAFASQSFFTFYFLRPRAID